MSKPTPAGTIYVQYMLVLDMFISQHIFFGLNFRTSNKLLPVNNIEQTAIWFHVIHSSLKASITYCLPY